MCATVVPAQMQHRQRHGSPSRPIAVANIRKVI
jgi:hypothetical protein